MLRRCGRTSHRADTGSEVSGTTRGFTDRSRRCARAFVSRRWGRRPAPESGFGHVQSEMLPLRKAVARRAQDPGETSGLGKCVSESPACK